MADNPEQPPAAQAVPAAQALVENAAQDVHPPLAPVQPQLQVFVSLFVLFGRPRVRVVLACSRFISSLLPVLFPAPLSLCPFSSCLSLYLVILLAFRARAICFPIFSLFFCPLYSVYFSLRCLLHPLSLRVCLPLYFVYFCSLPLPLPLYCTLSHFYPCSFSRPPYCTFIHFLGG